MPDYDNIYIDIEKIHQMMATKSLQNDLQGFVTKALQIYNKKTQGYASFCIKDQGTNNLRLQIVGDPLDSIMTMERVAIAAIIESHKPKDAAIHLYDTAMAYIHNAQTIAEKEGFDLQQTYQKWKRGE